MGATLLAVVVGGALARHEPLGRRLPGVRSSRLSPPVKVRMVAGMDGNRTTPLREMDIRGFMVPLVDDVVRYPSKWPGEYQLGAVDYVQTLPEDRGYIVDVRPLRATGQERWAVNRRGKLIQEDVGRLRVVPEATFEKRRGEWFVPEAVSMQLLERVATPEPSAEAVEAGLARYTSFKLNLVRDVRRKRPPPPRPWPGLWALGRSASVRSRHTHPPSPQPQAFIVSAAIAAGVYASTGLANAQAYALGAAGGLVYLLLLSFSVDTVGSRGGGLGAMVKRSLGGIRLVALALPFLGLAVLRGYPLEAMVRDRQFEPAQAIPPVEFLALAFGVLTHRGPLLAREVSQALGSTTVRASPAVAAQASASKAALSAPPGSVAAAASVVRNYKRSKESATQAEAKRQAAVRARAGRRRPIVISGPSAVGKTTLIKMLIDEFEGCFAFCVSTTTRLPRSGEVPGQDYRFVSVAEFEASRDRGDFVEYVRAGADYYGTERAAIDEVCASGRAPILDVDVAGARAVYALPDVEPCCIFVSPPSMKVLERRMAERGANSAEDSQYRLRKASSEIEQAAVSRIYDYYLINDDLHQAYAELRTMVLNANPWLGAKADETAET